MVVGFGLWALFRITSGSEQHSYAHGLAPRYVQLVRGHDYTLAVRGGVPAVQQLGLDPGAIRCSATTTDARSVSLTLSAESASTKAINQIASFVSPVTGQVHVQCAGLSEVFVDDAANASPDRSGWLLVLATIFLAIGLPLALSVARRALRTRGREPEPAGSNSG